MHYKSFGKCRRGLEMMTSVMIAPGVDFPLPDIRRKAKSPVFQSDGECHDIFYP